MPFLNKLVVQVNKLAFSRRDIDPEFTHIKIIVDILKDVKRRCKETELLELAELDIDDQIPELLDALGLKGSEDTNSSAVFNRLLDSIHRFLKASSPNEIG